MPEDVFADDPAPDGWSDRARELSEVWSDPDAFRAWYEAAVVKVYRYLFGRTGGDAALTEELTQQTFIQAVHRRRCLRWSGRRSNLAVCDRSTQADRSPPAT